MAAGDEPGGPQRYAEGAPGTEGAGQLELLAAQASRRVGFTEGQSGQGRVGTPRQVARARRQAAGSDLTGRPKVAECVTEATLSEPKAAPGVAQYDPGLRRAEEVNRQGLKSPLGLARGRPAQPARRQVRWWRGYVTALEPTGRGRRAAHVHRPRLR